MKRRNLAALLGCVCAAVAASQTAHLQQKERDKAVESHSIPAECFSGDAICDQVVLRKPAVTLDDYALEKLQDANASGFIDVREVSSGRLLTHVSVPADDDQKEGLAINSPIRPLSVIKVYLAAVWLEHGFGRTPVNCPGFAGLPNYQMLVAEVLILGCDSAAEQMAVILRRKLGPARVLDDLRRYGLQDITLKPDASNTEWGRVLSLGEDEVSVTPTQLSSFLSVIGDHGGKVLSKHTARRLRLALEGVVHHGTAESINRELAYTPWRIGGKTGTGPGDCGDHCNGWFASLLSNHGRDRYVILVFIRGKGQGGGVAAHIAVLIAKYLIAEQPLK